MDLRTIYRDYLRCLNDRDWTQLGRYVDHDVYHNDCALGLTGYRQMLENDVLEIPDVYFEAELLIVDGATLAARLRFDCTPTHRFLGLPVEGRRIVFAENVFYSFRANKIVQVFSVIDKTAIESQL